MAEGYKVCSKCGRSLKESEFFKMKTGNRCDLCKDCLCQYIDNRKPETFKWILEMFDVPYIEKKWTQITNERYKKNPSRFGPKSVLGIYLRTMNMTQYRDFHYSDSESLEANGGNAATTPVAETVIDDEFEAKLLAQLEAGEISKTQYDTLTKKNADNYSSKVNADGFISTLANLPLNAELEEQQQPEPPQEQTPQFQFDLNYWTDQLDDKDISYLMLKWGTVYTPEQWIKMEQMYNKYAQEYDLNVDREEVLKKMCKTSLKMDEALDAGDVTGYKNLAAVFDQLRKSGKFTEAQNKDDKQQVLSSIGELVALCEQEGGIIPSLPQYDPDQYPQDKIDFTLRDLKSYTYSLVSNELGLGDLIESYIEKLEKSEEDSVDLDAGLVTSAEEAAGEELTDDEAEEWQYFLENEIEAEGEMLARFLDGEV